MVNIRPYASFVKEVDTTTSRRAKLEWSNTWIDDANIANIEQSVDNMLGGGRILLVGDSVIRMARSALAELEKCPVDLIASSYNLDDQLFVSLVDGFFENICYQYKAIFVQISHHGSGLQDLTCDPVKFDAINYENNLRSLVAFLRQFCDKIILVTVMEFYRIYNDYNAKFCPGKVFHFLNRIGIVKHHKDQNKNLIAEQRNRILQRIAEEEQLVLLDMKQELISRHSYIVVDSIHPENKMKPYMAKAMSEILNRK